MSSILTLKENKDSSDNVRLAFDRYFTKEISYPSNKVDAVVGFFRSRGFDEEAANSVGSVLLEQSKIDLLNVMVAIPQLSEEPLSISALVITTCPVASNTVTMLCVRTIGFVVS